MLALDILVEELSVAVRFPKSNNFVLWYVVDSYRRSVEVQGQTLRLGVVSCPVDLCARLQAHGLVGHYLTLDNLGFFALAALLAPRVALARIAPAEALLWPEASIFF